MRGLGLVMAVLLLGVSSARAESLHIIINGKAVHLEVSGRNEDNWGAGFEYDFRPRGHWIPFATASGFKDSHSNMSYYAGGGAKHRFSLGSDSREFHIDAGIVGFLMTRKGFHDDRPFPGALPFVSLGTDRVAINAVYIPKMQPKMAALFFFQLSLKVADL